MNLSIYTVPRPRPGGWNFTVVSQNSVLCSHKTTESAQECAEQRGQLHDNGDAQACATVWSPSLLF